MQIVWFKRDLRIEDHRPLVLAARCGPVLPLFVAEPELWQRPDMAGRQWDFVAESLTTLRRDLGALGQPLILRCGDIIDVLDDFRRQFNSIALWSHEETGNGWTYDRDKRVASWAREAGVSWTEVKQSGV
ncbi:MAG: deoxyribodipyrimidine photo-lyase, partial [Pseudomonadota bacterium]